MATHSPITNAEIDIDSPVTEALLKKYRDNPVADLEGNGTGVAFAALANVLAGDIQLDGMSPRISTLGNSNWQMMDLWDVYTAGTYRIRLVLINSSINYPLSARIYRNGAAYGTERTVTNADAVYTQDLSFSVGDTIEIWVRRQSPGGLFVGYVAATVSVASSYHASIFCPNSFLAEQLGA